MRTETVTIYQFNELPEAAQQATIDKFRDMGYCWGWQDEWWDSAQAFSKIAPIDITKADYDRGQVSVKWTDEDEIAELVGLRAWKWLQNNGWFTWAAKNKAGDCTMTGFFGDCAFGDAIMVYADKPLSTPELKQVFYEAAQAWVREAQRDCEYAYSDAAIRENIEVNEYEFYADGSLV